MEGPNDPSVYQHILKTSNAEINANTPPMNDNHQKLSIIYTNHSEDPSVRDKGYLYDEIDDIKFELQAKAVNKPSKRRSSLSFLSNFLFHRKQPRPISVSSHQQFFSMPAPEVITTGSEYTPDMETSTISDAVSLDDGQVSARPYNWPHDSSLDKSTTALVIVDMQKDCMPANPFIVATNQGYLAQQGIDNQPILDIVPKVQELLNSCREAGFPVYHTREGHRPDLSTLSSREKFRSKNNASTLGIGDRGPLGRLLIRGEKGHEIIDELTPLENEQIIDKPGRSAFQHTEFRLMLNIRGIKNLIICGVTTDVCVTSTMREANDNNFDCVLVEDACAAGVGSLHSAAVESITEEGGIFGAVTTVEKILQKIVPKFSSSSQKVPHSNIQPIDTILRGKSRYNNGTSTQVEPPSPSGSSLRARGRSAECTSLETTDLPLLVEKIAVTDFIDDGTAQPLRYTRERAAPDPLIPHKRRDSQTLKRGTRGVAYNVQKSGAEPITTRYGTSKLILNVSSSSEDDDEDAGVELEGESSDEGPLSVPVNKVVPVKKSNAGLPVRSALGSIQVPEILEKRLRSAVNGNGSCGQRVLPNTSGSKSAVVVLGQRRPPVMAAAAAAGVVGKRRTRSTKENANSEVLVGLGRGTRAASQGRSAAGAGAGKERSGSGGEGGKKWGFKSGRLSFSG
ncbi:isochorismatase family hydrolase protein [Rutstroemia sp. NJR-2017a BVV2]|nr:isochorismatase family hydrolase protein [Rutstroemia sp. NJR-2017a BVV2]